MECTEALFDCGDSLTPEIAANLAQTAERYEARLWMECDGKRVMLDSLIGILSLDCHRGTRVEIIAEGTDARAAAEAVAAVLRG